jgi:peptide-methionine (R)-S-oxide reductase
MSEKITKSKQQWRLELTPEQYRVCREKGTERPFSGQYWNHQEKGRYRCVCCGEVLFSSDTKFDAGCGWPSFSAPIAAQNVATAADHSHDMQRTEVLCGKCGAHLGHVFADGPQPTGLRYCINSVALQFQAAQASPFQELLNARRANDPDRTD